jgi:hypothetical protein
MAKRKAEALCNGKQGGYHEGQRDWSDEETVLLLRLHASNGNAWKLIASYFPGRTCNSIRNRLYRMQKNIESNQNPEATGNRCSKCGLRRRGHLCSLGVTLGTDASQDVFPFPDTLLVDYEKLQFSYPSPVDVPVHFAWPSVDNASLKC